MPPITLSDRQVVVGPNYPDAAQGGRVTSLNVPLGPYDLAALVRRLPADQKPDLIVVQADAFENCKPVGLAAVPGMKLLLAADTHHGQDALTRMVAYAKSEPFDRIAVLHDPHHLHWLSEAGLAGVRYIPNANVRDFSLAFAVERRPLIAFIGQAGPQHPRRTYLLEVIRSAGLPLSVRLTSPLEAAQTWAAAQISFNCSLNGDLNMRVFEVLAAGGFLLTDRLSPQAGLEALLRPGDHYVDYAREGDLIDKLKFYLSRPDACLKIARAGQAAYRAAHTPEHRRQDILDHAFGQPPPAPHDRRADPAGVDFGENLAERMRLYETLQLLSLERDRFIVAADERVGARTIADLADLRPLEITAVTGPVRRGPMATGLASLGVERQVRIADEPPPAWDMLLMDGRAMAPFEPAIAAPRALLAILHPDAATPEDRAMVSARGFAPVGGRDWLYGRQ